ncbi:MAG TPA: glycosyltransferase family 2 protein [Thermoanaerobaculia bacterium]|nr:glycosyltransferase family 2 protein [Thermoanaerobaculia bacterium]
MKLIIQIPAYNEEATIGETIAALPRKVPGFDFVEVLVIDDGSRDGTVEAARKAGADHVVRLSTNRGLSQTFLTGIDACLRLGADVIVNTDADHQYRAEDIPKLVAPVVTGKAEVVIGDRDIRNTPHMGPLKKGLQRIGSWAVGRAAGLDVPDVTSGFRAFSREAAYQINVFNPFTYTLETIIQAGHRNLSVQSVTVGTNPPTRPSRLYRGMSRYVRKSIVTIFRVYTIYRPLKTFVALGSILFLAGFALGVRYLYYFFAERAGGHVQSLILAAILLIIGFQTALIGLIADLIAVNRKLSEEVLIRMRKLDPRNAGSRARRRERGRERGREGSERPSAAAEPSARRGEPATQWVWLFDESKLEGETSDEKAPPKEEGTPRPRRRRRRRAGPRPAHEIKDRKHHPRRERDGETPDPPGEQ